MTRLRSGWQRPLPPRHPSGSSRHWEQCRVKTEGACWYLARCPARRQGPRPCPHSWPARGVGHNNGTQHSGACHCGHASRRSNNLLRCFGRRMGSNISRFEWHCSDDITTVDTRGTFPMESTVGCGRRVTGSQTCCNILHKSTLTRRCHCFPILRTT